MSDVLGYYMKTKEAEIAEKDKLIAEINKAIVTKTDSFVTYLVNENKSNEEIKRIVKDVTDEFINKIRESIDTQ